MASLMDFIFPKNCLNCRSEGGYVCSRCISKVQNPKSICPECTRPSIDGFTHTKCQKKYGINGLLSLWNYEGVIRKAVLSVKYKYATEVASELIGYVSLNLESKKFILGASPIVSPIPLHWYRENLRGFNQSYILGKEIAKKFGWIFVPDLLIRKKLTTPQAKLKADKRRKNIVGVFDLNPKYQTVPSSCILFDDVYTTGSTMKEAAKVLKRKGSQSVWGLTIAK